MELATNEAVKQAVIAGLGYSIMPMIGLKDELDNGSMRIVPVEGLPLTTSWHLIWLKKKRLSPAAQAYLRYVRTTKHKVIEQRFAWLNKEVQP
jgi:Transcriptional regulator